MIRVRCECGAAAVELAEDQANRPLRCRCGRAVTCVSAEALPEGAGAGDFDVAITVRGGPSRDGECLLLGGCAEIGIGKSPDNAIVLPGKMVSRHHCRLSRIDFGPSRWRIEDNKSTNGLFVNGERVSEHELRPGDVVHVGEYELAYSLVEEPALVAVGAAAPASSGGGTATLAAPTMPAVKGDGPVCPSCERTLGRKAKICVQCGIKVDTGRPMLTSQGLDENTVHANSETIIRILSWIVWVTPMPMPIASEAYGTRKPYTIWTIAAITVLASLIFFFAVRADSAPSLGWMLWPPGEGAAQRMSDELRELERQMLPENPTSPQARGAQPTLDEEELEEAREMLREAMAERAEELRYAKFAWWQLFTHALLHDPNGVIGLLLHLGGNMLFLLVFGSRVNALIGSAATVAVYPILAAAAAGAHLLFLPADEFIPMLGASGAVNGLAGMYLILFPVHRVYCAMWFRIRLYLALKIFALRGFWVILIYIAYDMGMIALGVRSGTAHWAHVGGFLTGVVLGLAILFSRQFNCRNGDLLSVMLGKHAWPLIGKPSRWAEA